MLPGVGPSKGIWCYVVSSSTGDVLIRVNEVIGSELFDGIHTFLHVSNAKTR